MAQDMFLASQSVGEQSDTDCGMTFDVASSTVSNQGKFAVWHEALQAVIFVDSPAFTPAWSGSIVYAYKPADGATFEVYRCDTCTVGSVMPRRLGGLVLAISIPSGTGFVSSVRTLDVDPNTFSGSNLQTVVDIPLDTKGKFNNGNCDPSGRLWVGTFDYGFEAELQGKVWVIERQNASLHLRVGIDGIGHPNGLVWNPEGTELLFSRTYANEVLRYQYSLVDGTVASPDQVIVGDSGVDLFDSMCGFTDGSFIVTEPGFWRLKHYNSDGSLKCVQNLPGQSVSKFVASCAFAGGDLYVPTGRNGGDDAGPDGWVFRVRGVDGGLVSHACDI